MTSYNRENYIRKHILNIEFNPEFKIKYPNVYNDYIPRKDYNTQLFPTEYNLVNSIRKIIFNTSYNKLHPKLVDSKIQSYCKLHSISNEIIWNSDNQGIFIQINIKYINTNRSVIITLFRCSKLLSKYISKSWKIFPNGRYINVDILT